MSDAVRFEAGGLAVDDRGSLKFVNGFDLALFKRFYVVENHSAGFVRAWHGHQHEAKAVICIKGAAILAGVKVDNWDNPSKNLPIERFIMSETKFGALHIPAGYANGFKTLTPGTVLMFLSSSTLEESASDDIRFDASYWNPWTIEER